jgi:hypothetical protein
MATDADFFCVLTESASMPVLFCRFVCCNILHLSVVDEVLDGIKMMKYAINHRYKFKRYFWAFLCGYFKCISGMSVELVSILVICAAYNIIDVTFNFIALAVIADFDDIVFASMRSESFSLLLTTEFT